MGFPPGPAGLKAGIAQFGPLPACSECRESGIRAVSGPCGVRQAHFDCAEPAQPVHVVSHVRGRDRRLGVGHSDHLDLQSHGPSSLNFTGQKRKFPLPARPFSVLHLPAAGNIFGRSTSRNSNALRWPGVRVVTSKMVPEEPSTTSFRAMVEISASNVWKLCACSTFARLLYASTASSAGRCIRHPWLPVARLISSSQPSIASSSSSRLRRRSSRSRGLKWTISHSPGKSGLAVPATASGIGTSAAKGPSPASGCSRTSARRSSRGPPEPAPRGSGRLRSSPGRRRARPVRVRIVRGSFRSGGPASPGRPRCL